MAFYHVTLQNAIGLLSKPERHARNFSNFSLAGALTNFVGPLIAGFSIDHFGYAIACLWIVGLSLIAVALLLIAGRRLPPGNPGATASAGTMKSLVDPDVLRMIAATCLVQLGTDIFQFYIPIYGHSIGLSATAIGYVLASFAAASFFVRFFLPRLVKEVRGEKLLAWSFYAGAAGFLLVPLFTNVFVLTAVAFVFGLGMGLGTPLTVILMFGRATQGRSGQILGLRLAASNSVRVFGPIVFGALGTAFGLMPVFVINAMFMASGGVISHLQRKRDEV
jgi:predicted MFS family arabinose efflux permease